MGDVTTNYKVNVGVDDAKWKEFVKSVAGLSSAYGGATKAAVESNQKIVAAAQQSATKQTALAKQFGDFAEKTAKATAANEAALLQQGIKEREKAEKIAEQLTKQEAAEQIKASKAEEQATARALAQKVKAEQQAEKLAQKAAAVEAREAKKSADAEAREAKKAADAEARERMRAANARVKEAQQAEKAAIKQAEIEAKEAKKAADAQIKEAQRAEKEAEKQADKIAAYKLKVFQKSIADAEKAEAKANKPKPEHHDGHGEHGGGLVGLAEGAGIVAAIEGVKILKEKTEEAAKAQGDLQAATGLSGKQLEEASEEAEKLGKQYKIGGDEGKEAMARVASFTGATGEALKRQTEDAIILAQKMNVSVESAAKMLGKASDPEVASNLTKLGISLDKNATAEERAAKIHEAAMAAKVGVDKANASATKNLNEIMMEVQETIAKLAGQVLTALMPAITALMPVIDTVGKLLGDILKPLLDSLTPVITLVANSFSKLAPIIVDLITTGLQILTPIISDLSEILQSFIPPLIEVAKTILEALQPVFKALTPIIAEVAGIIKDILMANMGMFVDILQNVLVPLIRDLVAPILMSLMPIIKLMADLMQKTLVPGIQLLSGVMNFLMTSAVQPLIKWLSGGLVSAINTVMEVVTAAVKVISKITDAIGSLLGLGGDAAVAATKSNVKKVNDVEKQGQEEAVQQLEKHQKVKEKKVKDHTDQVRKSYIQQQQDLIDLDEQTYDEAIEKLQKYYTTLAESNVKGRREVSNAIEKFKAAEFDQEKKAEDLLLKQQELALLKEGLNDEDYKEQKEALTIQHLERLKDIAEKNGQDTLDIQMQLINAQISQQKRLDAERVADVNATNEEIAKSNEALKEQSAKDELKMREDRKATMDAMKKQAEFFAGPISTAMVNTFHKLMKGADDWTAKMAASNNVLESIFGGILQGFLQMVEGMIEKIIAFEAVIAVADLIPGFSGLMDAMGGLGSLIPHADGGIINHADGGVGVKPLTIGRHQFFEAGPEAVIPLSSGRAQGMMQSAFGFDKALGPVVDGLSRIETHVARPRTVLPMNDSFENARNNYVKSEDRRSI